MKTSNALIAVLSVALLLLLAINANAQMGEIRGTVTDSVSGKPLSDVVVTMQYKGYPKTTVTDVDGNYAFKPLEPGTYNLSFQVFGKKPINVSGVLVYAEGIRFYDQKVGSGLVIHEVYVRPDNIDMRKDPIICTIPAIDIKNSAAGRNPWEIATAIVPRVTATDRGGKQLSLSGSRPDATQYYIDGVKVIGEPYVPQSGIEQVTVITGGLPAQYGDTTSGVVLITTKGMH